MRGEGKIVTVHVGNQIRHADRRLEIRIGQIAPESDRVGAVIVIAVLVVAIGGHTTVHFSPQYSP